MTKGSLQYLFSCSSVLFLIFVGSWLFINACEPRYGNARTTWDILSTNAPGDYLEDNSATYWLLQLELGLVPGAGPTAWQKTYILRNPVETQKITADIRYRDADLILAVLRDQDGRPLWFGIMQGTGDPPAVTYPIRERMLDRFTLAVESTGQGEFEIVIAGE